ncbi:hypothetical protein R5R35_001626 [Gryllus longicercus]|uniref:Parathyroid hormone/parathyroid hormone-related peptide receptor n=1 Tax=Gryllus longicercus TaxID=2509291 RepID=A0AAN9Z2S7_9ORTH
MVATTTPTTTALAAPQDEDAQTRMLWESQLACLLRIAEMQTNASADALGDFCPPVWDGILCWGRASPGQLLTQRCPAYIIGFHSQYNASRLCTDAGQWYSRDGNQTWTNFTQCAPSPEATVLVSLKDQYEKHVEPYLPTLKCISEVGHTVSLVSLVVAFLILVSFKKLRCPRNVLHMHLFASFIMRAFMSLLKDSLFVQGLGMTTNLLMKEEGDYFHSEHQTNWPCRMFTSLWQYCIMANYSWILMEGLYLHNLIFMALFTDSSSITLYIVLGWGLPAIFVLPWTLCRTILENTWCWTTNDNTVVFLLIRVPIIASVVVNFVLFINIVRVLLLKIKSSVCEENKTYRKWAKSTLVLVPLFGVHYMIFLGLHLSTDTTVEIVWLFCDQLFASFNGFFLALLYCFLNGEVRAEAARAWGRWSCAHALDEWHAPGARGLFKRRGRPPRPARRASGYSGTCTTDGSAPAASCKKRLATATGADVEPAGGRATPGGRAAGMARAALHGSYHCADADADADAVGAGQCLPLDHQRRSGVV